MYIEKVKQKTKKKTYTQVLVRRSYRVKENGTSKVKHETVLNITKWPEAIQEAMKLILKDPEKVLELEALHGDKKLELIEGKSIGAVLVLVQVAKQLGITKALGRDKRQKELALWQIVARVLEQGSRLSSVRLHNIYALAEAIGIEKKFSEDHLYENLHWLSKNQDKIEDRLFKIRHPEVKPTMLLYDVTYSYFEGQKNELAAFGYNRDKKSGKKQIVVGLLCDTKGEPISIQVFAGNTQDPKSVSDQIKKTVERFGCEEVTFVGDRGMLKSAQREELAEVGFHYITAYTNSQIRKLIRDDIIQLDLFDEKIYEVQHEEKRLILRRNPVRRLEQSNTRNSKLESLKCFIEKKNVYLAGGPNRKVEVAGKHINNKISNYKFSSWIQLSETNRVFSISIDETAKQKASDLDGCYVLVSDLDKSKATAQEIHRCYKDLAMVEKSFRISKTGHLELRPIHVRSEESTRGHVFVIMLAYLLRMKLEQAWVSIDCTVEEGLKSLNTICTLSLSSVPSKLERIPKPRQLSRQLLEALNIELPPAIAMSNLDVATKKKLNKRKLNS